MELPRQEYWSELSVLSPGDLPDPAIEPTSPALAGRYSTKVCSQIIFIHINAILLLKVCVCVCVCVCVFQDLLTRKFQQKNKANLPGKLTQNGLKS